MSKRIEETEAELLEACQLLNQFDVARRSFPGAAADAVAKLVRQDAIEAMREYLAARSAVEVKPEPKVEKKAG